MSRTEQGMVSVARAEVGKEEVRNFAPRVHTEPHLRVLNFSAQVQRGIYKATAAMKPSCAQLIRGKREAFWRKPEYNLPGGLWSLRLNREKGGNTGPCYNNS